MGTGGVPNRGEASKVPVVHIASGLGQPGCLRGQRRRRGRDGGVGCQI